MLNLSDLSRFKGFRFPRAVISYAVWAYVRDPVARVGGQFAIRIRRDRPGPAYKWHLDEIVISIKGKKHCPWRVVDADGDVLEILVQSRVLVTDKLGSYAAAKAEIAPGIEHRQHKGLNNRAEASHRHTRRRKKIVGRFKSPGQAQGFLSAHD